MGRDVVAPVSVSSAQDVLGVVGAAVAARVVWQRVTLAWLVMAALAASSLLIAILVVRRRARLLRGPFEALSAVPRRGANGDLKAGAELSAFREIHRVAGRYNDIVRWLALAIENRRPLSANASHQQRTPRAWPMAQLSPDQGSVDLAHPIGALMGEVEHRWHDQLACEDRRVVVNLDPEATATEVPACLVTHVLDVLIGNALRHGWGDVTLTARQFGETLAVDVADEGSIGMESAAVFDRGTSGGEGQRAGLTLARSMAETFGGRLAVGRRSPATFTLLLPGDVPDVMRPGWLAEQRTSPVSPW
jgi:signal transduction histidine kinase